MTEPQTTAAAAAGPASNLRNERDRFVALAFASADVLFELDNGGNIIYAAGPLAPLVGVPAREVCGRALQDLLAPADRALMRALLASARRNERFGDEVVRLYGPQGPAVSLTVSGYCLADLNGHFFIAMRTPQAARKPGGFGRRSRDEASGLLETGSFIDTVMQHLADGGGDHAEMCSLIVMPDYARFRERLAAGAERELLAAVGARLQEASLGGDAASRLGDDRYAVLHGRAVDLGGLADSIARLTREADPAGAGLVVASATVQLDTSGVAADDLDQGIRYTVSRFRQAYDAAELEDLSGNISQLAQEAAQAMRDFNAAIRDGAFGLELQPVLNARTGAIAQLEALPTLPTCFANRATRDQLAMAEASGAIVQFDLAVLGKAVEWIKRPGQVCRLPLAINLSIHGLTSLALLARLDRVLRDDPSLGKRLIIDVSMTGPVADLEAASNAMQSVRDKGVLVGLAELGTGPAGFASLASLDVDFVRFAAPAIAEARKAPRGKAYLRALTGLCHDLGMVPAAQDIAEQALLEFARDCGIDLVHGPLFGPPAADFTRVSAEATQRLFAQRAVL